MQTFFIPTEQEFPEYSEPLFREISDIVNTKAMRPFYIESAEIVGSEDEQGLNLTGHFVAYDGLKIEVSFEGEYEDPEKASLPKRRFLKKENSFGNYTLEARLIEPSEQQSMFLSRFRLAFDTIRFRDGTVNHSPYYRHHIDPRPALADIKKLGKLVQMYDYSHTDFNFDALREAQIEFTRQLGQLEHFDYELSFLVEETPSDPKTMSSVLELKDIDHLVMGWITRLSAKIALPFKPGEELNPNAIALQKTKLRTHEVVFNYAFYYGEWDKVAELASWRVDVDWTLISELNSFRNRFYEIWRSVHLQKDDAPIELDEHQSRVHTFFEKFELIISTMGFYVQADYEDPVDMIYQSAFDEQIIKARDVVREEHPDYMPLYLVRSERPTMQKEGGQITFYNIESYRIFSDLMDLLLKDPLLPLDEFIELPEFYEAFEYDPVLENRARCYVTASRQDPNKANAILVEMDSAYPIAQRLEKEYFG